jgi:predicted Ser/Thr protein kinase
MAPNHNPVTLPFGAQTIGDTSPPLESDEAPVHVAVPGYEILGELGRGGMGVVYKAKQDGLHRLVALKMVLSGAHAAEAERQRFKIEAEAAAALQHPNIVQIYEIGEQDGHPYCALELCPGGSLRNRLNGTPIPPRDAARLIEQLARGTHVAHRAGIVHRDLKPGNVLLTADGTPKITDFGLAKRAGSDSDLTATGAIMGTPAYMAPEQAAGRGKYVGPAADIYSLGAMLYECLTGGPPFRADTPLDTLVQVVEHTPTPPQMLNPKVDGDLATICLKCLEKDPARRYESAEALADDLHRYQNGDSISARSYNMLDWVTRTLETSHYDVQFHSWGTMLLWFAAIVGLTQFVAAAIIWQRPPYFEAWLTLTHLVKFGLLGLVFWRNRRQGIMPTTTAERQMWSLWAGFLVACVLMGVINHRLTPPGTPYDPLPLYPQFAILTGLAFVVLGSSYWGGCYLIGAAFFTAAMVMPSHLWAAPAEFGLLWAAALVTIGLRLRRLSPEKPLAA